ncbi:MAG: Ig-like domain-containing protein [Burkholderiaceae bacterium]|nr:Ig-like domain-containing protein [Burkholderiaceae bacterium]
MKIRTWLAALCVTALAACGGGGDSGTPILGNDGGSGSTAASVSVSTDNATLGDGSSTITVTAVVKNANNVAMPATAITWSANAGSLTGAATQTDATGTATATFSATDSERAAGTATITAMSGSARGTASVALQGTRSVVLTSSKSQVGTDGDTATLTAVVRDGSNLTISGAAVVWTSSAGALSGQTSVTNANGVATATFTPTGINPTATPTATVTARSGTSPVAQTVLNISPSTTSVELLASQPTVGTGGEQVTVTAFVKDGNNLAKVGAPVSWSVDSGRISNQVATTNSNGIATAVLDAGSNKSNRTAVVTVNSGAARQTLNVPVVNTKLAYSGATTLAMGAAMQVTLTATDSKSVAIPGVTLALSSSLGNAVPATATTDSAGQAIVTYTATKSGADTLSVSGAGASVSTAITVSGLEEQLVFVTPAASTKVTVGQIQPLQLRYRKNGVAQANAVINLAATIGTLSAPSVTTAADGTATVNVSSGFAGSSTISATLAGSTSQPVQATLPINFIATTPAKLVLQLTPSALAPNLAGATTNQASVVAKVTDANGNPVADSTVNFSQVADPSGGRLQQASAVTDLNGVATVQYLSGAESTASGAVRLRGTVASNTAITGDALMTVNQSALFIALGTGNTISNYNTETYEKKWTVYVTDANGVAVTNVPLTIKVIPLYYVKGKMEWNETASQWVYVNTDSNGKPIPECPNEDGPDNLSFAVNTKPRAYDFNGILDVSQEDTNGDGTLTPGNVVALTNGVVTTDTNGSATITLRYAELYAPWIIVRLTATAIVSGTESTTFKDFPLDKLAGDFSVKTVAPAGALSPFGIDVSTCSNAR